MNAIGAQSRQVASPPPAQAAPPVKQKDRDGDYDNNRPDVAPQSSTPGVGTKVNTRA
jgi:hypothetical protein